jgi:hypothetical protein
MVSELRSFWQDEHTNPENKSISMMLIEINLYLKI